MTTGNGGLGGNLNELYFTAGPDDESLRLFGALQAVGSVPEPATLARFGAGLLAAFVIRRARVRKRGLREDR